MNRSAPQEADKLIGTMIGRYRVEKKIGEGGMGSVYELLQPAIHKRMALKLLHSEYASQPEIVQRFFDEARAVNLIGHPNIVDITDFSQLPDGRPFIIMEFLQGETLEEHLEQNGVLQEEEVFEILRPLCSALTAAHAKGIFHRDLKPENIFLLRQPGQPMRVKILDFGIAKLRDREEGEQGHRTQTGVVLGTPTYMSPEQAEGRTLDADHRTDIYSLSVILYQMLTGTPPFVGKTFAELIFKHVSVPPPSVSDSGRDLAPVWTQVVSKGLAKAPADRHQSVKELLAEASLAFDQSGDSTSRAKSLNLNKIPTGGRRARTRLAVVALIGVLGAGAGAAWIAFDRGGTAEETRAGPALIVGAPTEISMAPARPPLSQSRISGAGPATDQEANQGNRPENSSDAQVVQVVDAGAGDRKHSTTEIRAHETRKIPYRSPKNQGRGFLRVSADPWAQVYLDGKKIGQTPLQLEIPIGSHKIQLRNETSGAKKVRHFQLKRGKTFTIFERW